MVLELPVLARENQDWKIYRAHILDSAAAEGVVSHLTGAALKPLDSRELEAWNWSNSVAKYIMLEVISDSLLERLMHHELAHTLFSHLAAIFGNHNPIAIEPPAERSDQVEPLQEDSHLKSDGTDSARTVNTVEPTIADVDRKAVQGGEPAESAYRVEPESRKPMDALNESETLVIVSNELGDANGIGDQAEGSNSRMDGSKGQADGSGGETDTPNVSNITETAEMSDGEDAETYLGVRDVKRTVLETDGARNHADTLGARTDAPSIETDAITTVNAPQNVRIPRKRKKPPDLPIGTTRGYPDEPDSCGNRTDASGMYTGMHSAGYETEMTGNATGNVRKGRNTSEMQNSPNTPENRTLESICRRRIVSIDDIDIHIPWNTPVEAPGQTFAFGPFESGDEAIAPSVEGERAGNGNGDRNGDDGDGDGMASSGNVDSTRIGGVQLAGEVGQHERPNAEYKRNVPMLSRPSV